MRFYCCKNKAIWSKTFRPSNWDTVLIWVNFHPVAEILVGKTEILATEPTHVPRASVDTSFNGKAERVTLMK